MMLYGTECWMRKSQQEHNLSVAVVRMLCWMLGHLRKDNIRIGSITEKVGVPPFRKIWYNHG